MLEDTNGLFRSLPLKNILPKTTEEKINFSGFVMHNHYMINEASDPCIEKSVLQLESKTHYLLAGVWHIDNSNRHLKSRQLLLDGKTQIHIVFE